MPIYSIKNYNRELEQRVTKKFTKLRSNKPSNSRIIATFLQLIADLPGEREDRKRTPPAAV